MFSHLLAWGCRKLSFIICLNFLINKDKESPRNKISVFGLLAFTIYYLQKKSSKYIYKVNALYSSGKMSFFEKIRISVKSVFFLLYLIIFLMVWRDFLLSVIFKFNIALYTGSLTFPLLPHTYLLIAEKLTVWKGIPSSLSLFPQIILSSSPFPFC